MTSLLRNSESDDEHPSLGSDIHPHAQVLPALRGGEVTWGVHSREFGASLEFCLPWFGT